MSEMHQEDYENSVEAPQRVLVVSFEGWSDAGTAASSAVSHLASALEVALIAEIDAERYVDFQIHRPRVRFSESGERIIEWPNTKLWGPIATPGAATVGADAKSHHAAPDGTSHIDSESSGADVDSDEIAGALQRVLSLDGSPIEEIYVMTGVEPARHWRDYIDELMTLVMTWEIDLVIIVGSVFSDTPHSRPVPVNVHSPQENIRSQFDADRSDYEGPASIGTVFEEALTHSGVHVLSLFAQIPHYVHSMPSPKATLAILDTIEELINLVIPHGNLISDAQQWENQVSMLTQHDEEMQGYIERLEAERDTVESPEATGDALAYEFEKFLQRNPKPQTIDIDEEKQSDSEGSSEETPEESNDDDADLEDSDDHSDDED